MELKIKVLIFLLACVIINASCNNNQEASQINKELEPDGDVIITKQQFESSNFKLGNISKSQFEKHFTTTGIVKKNEKGIYAIHSQHEGRIGDLNINMGQQINKGHRICSISNPSFIDLQQAFLVSHSNLKYLSAEEKRLKLLLASQLTLAHEYNETKQKLDIALTEYEAIKEKLTVLGFNTTDINARNLSSKTHIYAQQSGIVRGIKVNNGSYVDHLTEIANVVNPNDHFIQLNILQSQVDLIRNNQPVLIFTTKGDTIHTQIQNFAKQHINNGKSIIRLEYNDPKDLLMPGTLITAKVILDNFTADALPESAIVEKSNGHFILGLKDSTSTHLGFEVFRIQAGEKNGELVELRSNDLDYETPILINGAYYLIQ